MRWLVKTKQYQTEWHDYFVWFPKILRDFSTKKRYWVWMETVRCRRAYTEKSHYAYWQYRLKWKGLDY